MTTLDVYKDWLGIADGPRPPDHYDLLRLPKFDDNVEKIRGNYKKLHAHVRKYAAGQHSLRSQELLNELAKAMICLTDLERKREYDEGLGRVFEEDVAEAGRPTISKVLIDCRLVSRDQLTQAEAFAEARGLSLRDALVQMKLVEPAKAAEALAEELGHPFLELSEVIPDDSVLDKVPRSTVKRHTALPLFIDDDMVLVACVDEPAAELEDEIRLRFGLSMRPVIALPTEINQGIAKYYAAGMRDESVAEEALRSKGSSRRRRKRYAMLSPEEQEQRRNYGLIFMCWGLVGPILIDRFVLYGHVFPYRNPVLRIFDAWIFQNFLLTLFVPWLIAWWVIKEYWK